ERTLGTDPKTGKPVIVRIGRFGPLAQIGEGKDKEDEKPQFASLLKGQLIESITLEEALELFKLPRTVGQYEDKDVVIGVGRFGPYVRHNSKFTSLKKTDDPL
ncbi:MAG TPA: DNA topoisomerase I, partial [Bacteroidales bacterium]|nr:DNA topoisomerase I [Bacteroidales bacterium]